MKEHMAFKSICARLFSTNKRAAAYAIVGEWKETARRAAAEGFEGFSSTLLYSRYQDHEELQRCGFDLAEKYGIAFVYDDFRSGWQYGIEKSKEYGMYRQPYCGCIYSEQERYDPAKRKKPAKNR